MVHLHFQTLLYVSTLFDYASCDQFVDLSKSRKVYEERIGKDGVSILLTENELLEDVKKVFYVHVGQAAEDKKSFIHTIFPPKSHFVCVNEEWMKDEWMM